MNIEATVSISLDDRVGGWEDAPTVREQIIQIAARNLLAENSARGPILASVQKVAIAEATKAAKEIVGSEFQPANRYGESNGKPTTLRAFIADEIRKELRISDRSNGYHDQTVLSKMIRDEVTKIVTGELKAALDEAKAALATELRTAAMKAIAEKIAKQ